MKRRLVLSALCILPALYAHGAEGLIGFVGGVKFGLLANHFSYIYDTSPFGESFRVFGWNVLVYYYYFFLHLFSDYPWVVRVSYSIILLCCIGFILLLMSMIVDIIVRERNYRRYTKIKRRYFEKLKEICFSDAENMSEEEIRQHLGYKERRWRRWEMLLWARIFIEVSLYTNTQDPNTTNMQKVMTLIGFRDYVERALIHGRRKIKVRYMEVVILTNMQLPNSTVTRMVNDKYEPLRKSARIYYMLTTKDNPNVFFEEEGSVAGNFSTWDRMEMHGVLNKMKSSGRNMPKFVPVIQNLDNGKNRNFVAFIMREIAYWSNDKELKYLFRYFDSSDLMFRQAAFASMGQRRFLEAEDVMKNIYYRQSEALQRVVLEAVFSINSGRSVSFFSEAFKNSVSEYTRREALRCLWLYGDSGRATFYGLKKRANEETKILFEHVENPLINNYGV